MGRQGRLVRRSLTRRATPMGRGISRRSPTRRVTLASGPLPPSARWRRRRIERPASLAACGPPVNTC